MSEARQRETAATGPAGRKSSGERREDEGFGIKDESNIFLKLKIMIIYKLNTNKPNNGGCNDV
ncbi:hypothetical protein YDYSY3_60590 [Paenibacillus chitinolyticus]|nr:hypothetical protein YDYSY3_60590 [Paenibacillus chitinolyticus]